MTSDLWKQTEGRQETMKAGMLLIEGVKWGGDRLRRNKASQDKTRGQTTKDQSALEADLFPRVAESSQFQEQRQLILVCYPSF